MFTLFVVLSISTANIYVSTSKSVVVDLADPKDLNLFIVSSNAIVAVSTTNGFDITAYDKDNTQIGKLSSSSPIIQLGPISGKLYVKMTGSQTKFACSVIIVSNLPIGKQCESVYASNNAQQDFTLTNSKLSADKVNCIWLSSPSTMSTQVSVNVQGTVDACSFQESMSHTVLSQTVDQSRHQHQTLYWL